MSSQPIIVSYEDGLFSVLRRLEDWGLECYDLAAPPRRFWADQAVLPSSVEVSVDARRVRLLPTPSDLLQSIPDGDSWQGQSRRSIARLWATYLVVEDPQRRMDARAVSTLAHQVSLVRHVLESDHLSRVLIADEVGLGKTVEIGLLLADIFRDQPGLRVLYLAPARLVDNVAREFDRLDLGFRRWKSGDSDARLTDPRIIASIHRAVHPRHFDAMLETTPWDVIVVDECHHLSDWAPGGGDPVEKFRLVRDLSGRQRSGSRLILLSGTPHQGHPAKFQNLLGLLRLPGETEGDLRGRVIYRTKEDVRDWRGNPLFPPRQVNEPILLDLGNRYRSWLKSIHEFYRPSDDETVGQARRRASGWRCAQALQWAASSPQAGLGFLVRQAIRSGWSLKIPMLARALAALRPYRDGAPDEPLESLFQRITREISRQEETDDLDDIEDESSEVSRAESQAMEALIHEGLEVLDVAGDEKWRIIKERILDHAGDEKVVLFAQPIETVNALARYLERVTGVAPAVIIGGQNDFERTKQEESFRKRDGPRFLVSSRAGGEGINLQVARRLVHVDVPWNPMEMEQRVGRIHRFGSQRKIIVDTLVVADSREADAYRVARRKLRSIASALSPERFEMIFSRVMSLLPPESLQNVLIEEGTGPLTDSEAMQLSEMVESGFHAWRNFHEVFSDEQKKIRQIDGGLLTWEDVEDFLLKYAGAEQAEGFTARRFELVGGESVAVEDDINVIRFRDGSAFAIGDTQGTPVSGPNDESVRQIGLNLSPVAKAIRDYGLPKLSTGAAHLKIGPGWVPSGEKIEDAGILAFLVQPMKAESGSGWQELTPRLECFEVSTDGRIRKIEAQEKRNLLRALLNSSLRTKGPANLDLTRSIVDAESRLLQELRRPADEQIANGIRFAVTPLFASVVGK